MMESSGAHEEIVYSDNYQVKVSVEIFVPVARKLTINYHGEKEPSAKSTRSLWMLYTVPTIAGPRLIYR